MIQQTSQTVTRTVWQEALAHCVNDPAALLAQLDLSDQLTTLDPEQLAAFPLRVPQSYVNKMRAGDPNDPLLRQVFPLIAESYCAPNFVTDPVGDSDAIQSPGVLQKYHGRALLITTGACAIHCRYCFRRHFPYSDSHPLARQWPQTLRLLQEKTDINEVILSGGDPLVLSDDKLTTLIQDLESIPHIKRLRIHTRLPIVLPERIDRTFTQWLTQTRLQIVMVLHANHANEIDEAVIEAVEHLRAAGCLLLNQSVLLKGVNDTVEALVNLSERLADLYVQPYYLHLLDPVKGASHFDVPEQTGIALIQQIRTQLPGYLVPRLVRELQGQPSKTIIA